MRARQLTPTKAASPLGNFPGHVPDRSGLDADIRVMNYAEFLTRLEPRIVERTRTGHWESTTRRRPGEPTEHGIRMKLLDLERERERERLAGIERLP